MTASRTRDARVREAVPVFPAGVARLMRPMLPGLTDDIVDTIQHRVTDYGPHSGGAYLASTRLAITQAVHYFVDHLDDASVPRTELDETLRRIGRGEAYEGRSLDSLRESFAIGAHLAWTRIQQVTAGQGVRPPVLRALRVKLFAFMDSLGVESATGYREAQTQLSDAAHQWRGRILDLILAGPGAASSGEVAALAAAGNWSVPERVVLVAVRAAPGVALPSARMLHPSTLATLHGSAPIVLHPAPLRVSARAELETLFDGHRLAIGCEVELADAAASLRWARRALELVDQGRIPDADVIDCAEHMSSLWIHAEPLLADIVRRTTLSPLLAEAQNSRRILGETLLAWIETMGASAPTLAGILGKHPQTIRYRLKRLRELFGDTLDNPERLLEMYLALRAGGPELGVRGPERLPLATLGPDLPHLPDRSASVSAGLSPN